MVHLQNVSSTKRLLTKRLYTKRLYTQRRLNKTSPWQNVSYNKTSSKKRLHYKTPHVYIFCQWKRVFIGGVKKRRLNNKKIILLKTISRNITNNC
jgi:hypothetical protein